MERRLIPSLWFVVPAQGRAELTRVCLRQLARTCEVLRGLGVDAYAVVIADDENLETAAECGHGTIDHPNRPLGAKWNSGFELAGREGADYVVPFGSDDWVNPVMVAEQLPGPDMIRCFRRSSVVNEFGTRLARLHITAYPGGDGIKIIPTGLLKAGGYRPAVEDYDRAIDSSIMQRLKATLGGLPFAYADTDPLAIVDWKTDGQQLNTYQAVQQFREGEQSEDPFGVLADWYPSESLTDMQAHYGLVAV